MSFLVIQDVAVPHVAPTAVVTEAVVRHVHAGRRVEVEQVHAGGTCCWNSSRRTTIGFAFVVAVPFRRAGCGMGSTNFGIEAPTKGSGASPAACVLES